MPDYSSLAATAAATATITYLITKHLLERKYKYRPERALEGEKSPYSHNDQSEALLTRQKNSTQEYAATLQLQIEHAQLEATKAAIQNFKSSDEFNALLSIEHAKGVKAGEEEERARFNITYTPIVIDHENFWSHKVDVGYDMQIYYAGFPIGEPTRRITHHQEKSKDENINKLLNAATNTLDLIAATATKARIPVTINKKPNRTKAQA